MIAAYRIRAPPYDSSSVNSNAAASVRQSVNGSKSNGLWLQIAPCRARKLYVNLHLLCNSRLRVLLTARRAQLEKVSPLDFKAPNLSSLCRSTNEQQGKLRLKRFETRSTRRQSSSALQCKKHLNEGNFPLLGARSFNSPRLSPAAGRTMPPRGAGACRTLTARRRGAGARHLAHAIDDSDSESLRRLPQPQADDARVLPRGAGLTFSGPGWLAAILHWQKSLGTSSRALRDHRGRRLSSRPWCADGPAVSAVAMARWSQQLERRQCSGRGNRTQSSYKQRSEQDVLHRRGDITRSST